MHDEPADPFGTAALRQRVLDAWAASPARLREDANAEEDYALGGYRDRVIVELAQNAADAAIRGGVAGRLRLTLREQTLTAANTGAPLDAAGVEALCTLRASGKRGDSAAAGTVGRFGVGFAAVVAVSDSPRIRSGAGAVCWSRERTRELAGAVPGLAAELAARAGHVPVLRLPFACGDTGLAATGETWPQGTAAPGGNAARGMAPAPAATGGAVPDGLVPADAYTTVVELPLRDDDATELVARLLAQTGPALLLALPALAEVVIEAGGRTRVLTASHAADAVTVTIDGAVSEWQVASADGPLDPALLADRPTEERARTAWSVRWAIPVRAAFSAATPPAATGRLPTGVTAVVHAPTPTDEPLGLPALLLASFPLGPDRRHVAPGPLTNFLIERAAAAYAALLPRLAPGPELLDLVPGPGGQGELDARLGRAITALLPDVPFLPAAAAQAAGAPADGAPGTAEGSAAPARADAGLLAALDTTPSPTADLPRVRPRDALLLAARAPRLAQWLASVLPQLTGGPARHPAYAVLGVRRLALAELADMLASLDRDPAWWRGLYAAAADLPADELAELGALPVPLADGRLVRGARGVLLPGQDLERPDRLAVLGLRVAHPAAAHPLLARLGAVEATPRRVLEDPATRAAVANSYDSAVEASYDDENPRRLADVVLGLVAAVAADPGEYPYLADLALPGDDGDWYPAGELLLPGSPLAEVIAADAPFGTVAPDIVRRYGQATLAAAGVLSSFALLTAADVELDEAAVDLDLDGARDWAADARAWLGSRSPRPLPPVALEVAAVRDLELVDPSRWPRAIELLSQPPARAALTEPTRVRLPDGRLADVSSYTAWWLRRHLVMGDRRPGDLRAPDSDPLLAGLYDEVGPAAGAGAGAALARALADPVIARALGVRTSLASLLAEPGGADDLLRRLADPGRPVTRPQLRALWSALATTAAPADVTPPEAIRAVRGDAVVVADADDVLILDAPDLWPLLAASPLVLAPHELSAPLADLLDLPLASEQIGGAVESAGERRPIPENARLLLPAAPSSYQAHDRLTVDGTEVPWRYLDGTLHASTRAGLAHGLAWAAGQWHARHLLAALLTAQGETARLLADADLDG